MFGSKKSDSVNVLILVCLTCAGAGALAIDFVWQRNQKPKGEISVPLEDNVLAKGDKMPQLEAQGWLNGPPRPLGKGGARVLVIDFWAHW
jgi:hypothetical protein